MEKNRAKKALGILLAVIFLLVNYSPFIRNIKDIPSELQIFEGYIHILNFGLPFIVKIEGDNVDALKFNGSSLKDQANFNMKEPLTIQTVNIGSAELVFKLFGILPIKQMKIEVQPVKKIFPGGNSI